MAQIIYLIGPRVNAQEMQRSIDREAPHLILFIDAAVQLRDQLKFTCSHYALGDADGGEGEDQDGNYTSLLDEVHPTEKDESDLALALKFIEEKLSSNTKVQAFGLWGGRFDHQLANLGEFLCLCQRHPHIRISWYGEDTREKALIACGENEFDHEGLFSVFTLQENTVSIKGNIKYPLHHQEVSPLSSLGLSNEASGTFSIEASCPYLVIFSD